MPTCPTCFASYPAEALTCVTDGAKLVPDTTFAHVDKDAEAGMTVGEYTIEAKLGEGGFGAVFSAVHPLIGKRAAVKILSRQFSSNPQMVSRFIAEARAVNQIRHRNIIDIFSFGQLADGRQYYIMELLDGMTFDAYLAKQGPMGMDQVFPILRGVARALDAAHAKGILHRDLKPENVFLVIDEDGQIEPKLLDFGLVKLLDDASSHKTKTGTPMGTPYYMSPEQCRGLDVDVRTDVYAFGAMVFQVLTGEVPYDGSSAMDILMQHMSAPPPSPSKRSARVPSALDGPMARIMAKDPADRPVGVGAALDLLAAAAGIASDAARVVVAKGSGNFNIAERGAARTVLVDSGPPMNANAISSPEAPHVTLLGTESDVGATTERKKRSWLVLAVPAVVLVMVGVGVAGFIGRMPARGTNLVASAPPPATSTAAPALSAELPAADVDVTIDGVPDDTTVTADGVEIGHGRGPFKLRRSRTVKLAFAAKGFKPKDLTLTPAENVLLSIALEKQDRPAAKPPAVSTTSRPVPAASGSVHPDIPAF